MAFVVLGVGILFIIGAIAVFKIHPFLALLMASFLVGVLSPLPLDLREKLESARSVLKQEAEQGRISSQAFQRRWRELPALVREESNRKERPPGRQAVDALELTTRELGSTAASIAVVIALAAIIGQCLLESGAADKITRRLLRWLGEKRASTALLGSGYFLSIPVFFDTVFFLLVPLARALRVRTGRNFVLYVMAISAGAVITHSLVPPTPGPLIMVENLEGFGLNLGTAIGVGFLLGLLPAAAGLYFSARVNRRLDVPLREALGSSREDLEAIVGRSEEELPSLAASVLPVLLPVVLIAGATLLDTLEKEHLLRVPATILGWSAFLGNKNFALFAAAACAILLVRHQQKLSLAQLREKLEPAVMSAGVIILITSAGGAFGKMLARCGISEALQALSGGQETQALGLVLLSWGLAAMMKIAQGSGTVAMITASGIMAALLGGQASSPCHPVYIFASIGFGSLVVSWMNDSGFWVVCKMSGFTEEETLRTWTPLLIVIAIAGLVEVVALSVLFPLATP
ncbi:MAG: GntP family permease [Acidobacteriota bacterium]